MRINTDDSEFVDWLLDVGSGKINFSGNDEKDSVPDNIEIPRDLISNNIINDTFGKNVILETELKDITTSRVILSMKMLIH